MSTPVVDCVVVAYHRPDSLRALLEGLAHPEVRIIVVNVDSDPHITELAGPHGQVVELPGNPGYASAVNEGCVRARSDVVVFMNDDVLVAATDVLVLAATIAAGEADVVVPSVIDDDGRRERNLLPLPTPGRLLLEWALLPDHPVPVLRRVVSVEKWRLPETRERIVAASATVVACSRAVLRRHPLPEVYFLYWEENEWFWTLAMNGVRVTCEPSVAVVHRGGRADVRPDKSALLARNAVLCVRRTQGRVSGVAAVAIVIVWNVRLLALAMIRPGIGRRRTGLVAARAAGLRAALASWKVLR